MKKTTIATVGLMLAVSIYAAADRQYAGHAVITGHDSSLTEGWRKVPFDYAVHKAYDVDQKERFSYDKSTQAYSFLLKKEDNPFKQDSKTAPRTEMRIKNDYTSGLHQFEADYKVARGSNHPIVMQLFGTDKPGFMLKAYDTLGGAFRQFDSKILDTAIYDKWKHVNIIHNADDHTILVYIDGTLRGSFRDKGAASHYFKCGLYTTRSAESKVEIRNIQYWTK
jgi:hypothetical protein